MFGRLIYGHGNSAKDRRLNRQARMLDPPRQFDALQRFAPANGHNCQDPRHNFLHRGAHVVTRRQLIAPAAQFPLMAYRRQRRGGWGWVKLYRPDGLPIIPPDAPSIRGLRCIEAPGPIRPFQHLHHSPEHFFRDLRPERLLAARRCDDEWEHIPSPNEPYYPWENSGRRPSYHRHRPIPAIHGLPMEGDYPHHHHNHPGHRHSPRQRHHPGPQTLDEDDQISAWLQRGGGAGHQMEPFHFRQARHPRQHEHDDPTAVAIATDDEDEFYYDNDEDDEIVRSDTEMSTKSSW